MKLSDDDIDVLWGLVLAALAGLGVGMLLALLLTN